MVSVGGQLARAYMLHEEPKVALEWAESTLAAAERLDMVTEVAEAMNTKALVLQYPRSVHRIDDDASWGPVAGRAARPDAGELRAYNNLSFLLVTADPRTALEVAQVGIARASKVAASQWVTLLASNGASAALRTGDWATAELLIETWIGPSADWISQFELQSNAAIMAACRGAAGGERALSFDFAGADRPTHRSPRSGR